MGDCFEYTYYFRVCLLTNNPTTIATTETGAHIVRCLIYEWVVRDSMWKIKKLNLPKPLYHYIFFHREREERERELKRLRLLVSFCFVFAL